MDFRSFENNILSESESILRTNPKYKDRQKRATTNGDMFLVFQDVTTVCVPPIPPDNANLIECIDTSGKKVLFRLFNFNSSND